MENQISLELEDNKALEELFSGKQPGDEVTLKNVKITLVDHIEGKSVTANIDSVAGNDTNDAADDEEEESEDNNDANEQIQDAVLGAVAGA